MASALALLCGIYLKSKIIRGVFNSKQAQLILCTGFLYYNKGTIQRACFQVERKKRTILVYIYHWLNFQKSGLAIFTGMKFIFKIKTTIQNIKNKISFIYKWLNLDELNSWIIPYFMIMYRNIKVLLKDNQRRAVFFFISAKENFYK